jgi:hypothetical protein
MWHKLRLVCAAFTGQLQKRPACASLQSWPALLQLWEAVLLVMLRIKCMLAVCVQDSTMPGIGVPAAAARWGPSLACRLQHVVYAGLSMQAASAVPAQIYPVKRLTLHCCTLQWDDVCQHTGTRLVAPPDDEPACSLTQPSQNISQSYAWTTCLGSKQDEHVLGVPFAAIDNQMQGHNCQGHVRHLEQDEKSQGCTTCKFLTTQRSEANRGKDSNDAAMPAAWRPDWICKE